jgi:hypothetical protein
VDPPRDSVLVMQATFTKAADMHARYWCDKTLISSPLSSWLKGADWYNGNGRIRWELAIDAARKAWSSVKQKANAATPQMIDEKKAIKLSPKLVSIMVSERKE